MPFITWNDHMSVHVAQFDQHHQKLVTIINDLHSAMMGGKTNEILEKLFDDLVDYTKTHFKAEEVAMQKYGYPRYLEHQKIHSELTQQVLDLQADFHSGKMMVSVPLLNLLRDWLLKHIQGEDAKYADFFNAKGLT